MRVGRGLAKRLDPASDLFGGDLGGDDLCGLSTEELWLGERD